MQGDKAIKASQIVKEIADKKLLDFYKENQDVIDEFRRLQKESSQASLNDLNAKINRMDVLVANRKNPGKLF